MREKLMEVLAEPGTGSRLELTVSRWEKGRILEGTLVSRTTGRSYPILRGIPRFVPQDNYTESFGFQWNKFRTVQLDSATGASYSRRRYEAEAGWSREELEGRWLLDAGCGAGRFAEIAASLGPNLVALDYSSAVDATAETLASFPNVDVVQGNLLEPPLRKGAFDFAYCIGVIQHTPNPQAAIRNVLACVRTAGGFAFTIYGRKPWTKLNGKYLIRPITKRIPAAHLLKAVSFVMPVLFPVTDVLFRLPVLGKLASFAIPVANHLDHHEFSREQRYRETVLDTFDALSPTYDSPMTADEVAAVLRSVRVHEWTFRARVPVNVVGTR